MRRCTVNLWAACAVIALAVFGVPAAHATSEDERPAEIGILAGAGFGDEKLVGDGNSTEFNPLLGGRLAIHFTPRVSGFLDGTWVDYSGDPNVVGDAKEYAFRVGPEWYVNYRNPWQFFVNAGFGVMKISPDIGPSDGRGFASVGVGVRRGWPVGALRFELRGDRTVTDADILGGKDISAVKAMIGWSFGIGARPKDSDGDGVFDKKDKCPDTPIGAVVDADGCPKDSDGDGVFDGIDQCPDTPAGWPVDARGCPTDTDGDGVMDGQDKCPDTPKGATVDKDGCPADADGDGVFDGLDQCPNTMKGCRVDAKGCPIDSDSDGVCDGIDQCPGTTRGLKVDAKGCPPPPPPVPAFIPEAKKELVLERVYFETNSSKLKAQSSETLDKVAESLKGFPDVKLQVAGHSDSTGSDAYNMKLSQARAKSVMDYLVSKGVNPANLTAKGYGETEPLGDNKTSAGRSQNRRVGLRRLD